MSEYKIDLKDGTTVEFSMSGKVYGPDSGINLNYGTTYCYWRFSGGHPWQNLPAHVRTLAKAIKVAERCETWLDFDNWMNMEE